MRLAARLTRRENAENAQSHTKKEEEDNAEKTVGAAGGDIMQLGEGWVHRRGQKEVRNVGGGGGARRRRGHSERRRGASTDMHDGEDGLRQGHCGVRVKASPFTKKESI